jgi:VanZ family protein
VNRRGKIMIKFKKTRLKMPKASQFFFLWITITTCIITYFSLIPVPEPVTSVSVINLNLHIITYFCYAALFVFYYRTLNKKYSIILNSLIMPSIVGVVLEAAQEVFTTTRVGSLNDIINNEIGIVISVVLFTFLTMKARRFKYADKIVERISVLA